MNKYGQFQDTRKAFVGEMAPPEAIKLLEGIERSRSLAIAGFEHNDDAICRECNQRNEHSKAINADAFARALSASAPLS